jgi:hypothetical protein
MMSVYNFFLENLSASDSLSDVGSNYASTFPIVAISIAAAFCYICVPSIAGFIINSTGAKDITHEAVSRGEGSAKQVLLRLPELPEVVWLPLCMLLVMVLKNEVIMLKSLVNIQSAFSHTRLFLILLVSSNLIILGCVAFSPLTLR